MKTSLKRKITFGLLVMAIGFTLVGVTFSRGNAESGIVFLVGSLIALIGLIVEIWSPESS